VLHDSTYGVYPDDADSFFFKIGRSNFKYSDKHVFLDGRNYRASQELWELLTKFNLINNAVTIRGRRAYK